MDLDNKNEITQDIKPYSVHGDEYNLNTIGFQQYINNAVKIPLITEDEKNSHIYTRAKNGDTEARKRCIEGNLRLVMSIAKHYKNDFLDYADLVQEGNLGLIKAIDMYDEDSGNQFSTYATWWIKQSIQRAIEEKGRNIRLPAYMVQKINKVQRVYLNLSDVYGREPTYEELSRETGYDNAQIDFLLQHKQDTISLDMLVGRDIPDNETSLGDFISDATDIFEETSNKIRDERMHGTLNELTDRERDIICLRFGLNGEYAHTLDEVGKIYNVSRERIRQIQNKAMKKLRKKRALLEYKDTL